MTNPRDDLAAELNHRQKLAQDAERGVVQQRQGDPHYPWEVVFKGKTYPCESPMDAHRTLDALERAAERKGQDATNETPNADFNKFAGDDRQAEAQELLRQAMMSHGAHAIALELRALALDPDAKKKWRGGDKDFPKLNPTGSGPGVGFGSGFKKFEKA